MDRDLIKSLIEALARSDLSELEYSSGGETLRLVKGAAPGGRSGSARASAQGVTPRPPADPPDMPELAPADNGLVLAPLYGVVHLKASPDAEAFVSVGQVVRAGQSLCLLEAMKTFTELRAEHDGTVLAVLVSSGQEVDAGQPLFRLG